jgi:hypothetical protein
MSSILSDMIDKTVPLEPILQLLNDNTGMQLNEKQRKVWLAGLTVAKTCCSVLVASTWLAYFQDVVM